uniref:Uncharacterized protein n=1 Tax=Quercus lobata TaxID=97700 RepID=A0A7N2MLD4_QUELO
MKPNYFPVLSLLDLSGTDIVSIPESLNRFTTLEILHIRNCQQLRQILGLPPFIKNLDASHCWSLDAQSSSRLLNQIGQIVCEGEKRTNHIDFPCYGLPYTEIPRWLNSKHQSVGNSKVVESRVGRKFPNVFVYFAFGLWPQLSSSHVWINVYLSINGFEKVCNFGTGLSRDSDDTLWIFSCSHLKLQKQLDESNPSDDNHVEVTYEWEKETDRNNPPFEIRRHNWRVRNLKSIKGLQIKGMTSHRASYIGGPTSSKPSSPSEESDSKILRGYCGGAKSKNRSHTGRAEEKVFLDKLSSPLCDHLDYRD